MTISRKKFVILFIISGFAFMFITTSILGSTGLGGFPQPPDSLLGIDSPVAWKSSVALILSPIKIILVGPLLIPEVDFLKDDPPPPFIGICFIFYWTILASVIHYLLGKSN
jgi:hypothetical protein